VTERSESAARQRLETFLQEIERMNVDDLIVVALPALDPGRRADQLAVATRAASGTGRDALLIEARLRARELLVSGFARRAYDPTWFGLNWGRSLGRSADRAALFAAAEDAAAAAVVEDVIDEQVRHELVLPFRMAAAMRGSGQAANPSFATSRVGVPGRFVLLLAVALTVAGGLVPQLILLALAWILQGLPTVGPLGL
jgi:hypothetical protein